MHMFEGTSRQGQECLLFLPEHAGCVEPSSIYGCDPPEDLIPESHRDPNMIHHHFAAADDIILRFAIQRERIIMYSLFYKEKNDFEIFRMQSKHIPPHLHKNLEVVYVLEGTLAVGIGTHLYSMEKGDIAIIFPEQIHHYQAFEQSGSSLYLLATPSLSGPFLQSITTLSPKNPVVHAKDVHPDIYYALETLLDDKDSPEGDVLHQAYVMIILARLLPHLTLVEKGSANSEDLVYRTVSYIAEHYTEDDLSLTKMAHDLFVSPFSLSRIFSGTFHMNFNKYLNITRLEYVRYLLEYTEQTITEAYSNAGFGSQRTFNRAFRDHFHMTPKEYREQSKLREKDSSAIQDPVDTDIAPAYLITDPETT